MIIDHAKKNRPGYRVMAHAIGDVGAGRRQRAEDRGRRRRVRVARHDEGIRQRGATTAPERSAVKFRRAGSGGAGEAGPPGSITLMKGLAIAQWLSNPCRGCDGATSVDLLARPAGQLNSSRRPKTVLVKTSMEKFSARRRADAARCSRSSCEVPENNRQVAPTSCSSEP